MSTSPMRAINAAASSAVKRGTGTRAERGELDEHGKPSLLRAAVLGPAYAGEMRLASPPWFMQRATYAVLAPIARLRGYTRNGS